MEKLLQVSDEIARELCGGSKDAVKPLSNLLRMEIEKLLTLEVLPEDLAQGFSEDPFEKGTVLKKWCMENRHNGNFPENVFLLLSTVAKYMDIRGASANPLLAFVPDWFSVDGAGKIIIAEPLLKLATPDKGLGRLKDFQRSLLKPYLHPNLLKSLRNCEFRTALVFSFSLFLLDLFLDVQGRSIAELKDGLKKCGAKNHAIPPGLAEAFTTIIAVAPNQEHHTSCEDMVEKASCFFRENPFNCGVMVDPQFKHDVFGYSVPGLNKKMNSNEDRFLSRTHNNITFFMVADGVSTADIGTGEIAAEEVVRLFKTDFFKRFETLAVKLEQNIADDPAFVWYDPADDFLVRFFREASERVTTELNKFYKTENFKPPFQAPMCTTLSAAVVVYDQAAVRYAGDSPVMLFSPERNIFRKLTIDHHHGIEQEFTMADTPDSDALTRVIGARDFSQTEHKFVPSAEEGDPLRVQLKKGDMLLLASDGLIDCIDALTPEQKIDRIEKHIRKFSDDDMRLNELVRQLVALGENELSHDNITLNLLKSSNVGVTSQP
ncbi:MAG: hypothetical protein B6I30_06580 [Desulfobacteraceae bacterium 4572_187]|nr:MAG: hypothetical protein B6I30_06580 [Desulfobacteraceae bacterium 4572_187]